MNMTIKGYGGTREEHDEWFTNTNLARAKSGDTKAAGEICKALADWIENDQPIPPQAGKYLMDALREVGTRASSGYPEIGFADRAFLLRRGRGQPWWPKYETRNLKLAIYMKEYLRENPIEQPSAAAEHARKKLRAEGFDVRKINDPSAQNILEEYENRTKPRIEDSGTLYAQDSDETEKSPKPRP